MASHTKSFNGLCFQITSIVTGRHAMIIKASSSENELTDSNGGIPNSESDDEESLPLDKLPLESKLQLKLEQKMRMKMAKKIRLRRKKLVRKRRMRKKGRWPPSKMKKSKNVWSLQVYSSPPFLLQLWNIIYNCFVVKFANRILRKELLIGKQMIGSTYEMFVREASNSPEKPRDYIDVFREQLSCDVLIQFLLLLFLLRTQSPHFEFPCG